MATVTSIQSTPCETAEEAKASLSGALTDMRRTQKTHVVGTDVREVNGLYIAITHIELSDDPEVASNEETDGRSESEGSGSRSHQAGVGPQETPYIILSGGLFAKSDSPFTGWDRTDTLEEGLAAPNFSINEEIYTVGMLDADIHGRPIGPDGAPLVGVPETGRRHANQSDASEPAPEEPTLRP